MATLTVTCPECGELIDVEQMVAMHLMRAVEGTLQDHDIDVETCPQCERMFELDVIIKVEAGPLKD